MGDAYHPVTNVQCIQLPPNVHSEGIKGKKDRWGLGFSLPMLEMQMAIIFIITQVLHLIMKKFHISKFNSQLLAGILLGHLGKNLSLLGTDKKLAELTFPVDSQEVISVLGELGFGLFLFVIGVKMEVEMIRRIGRKAILTGTLCTLVPLVSGISLQKLTAGPVFGIDKEKTDRLTVVTAIHTLTFFPVVSLLLEELKLLNSEMGRLSLTATIVCELLSLFLQFVNRSISSITNEGDQRDLVHLAIAFGYVTSVAVIFRPIMLWVVRKTPDNRPVQKIYLNAIVLLVFVSGIGSHLYGQTFHFGPLIFGLAVPAGQPLGSALEEKFHLFVFEVFLPLFVTTYAMRADFGSIRLDDPRTQLTIILIVLIFVVKILATMVAPLYFKVPLTDAFVLALILSCRGIIHLGTYTWYSDTRMIDDSADSVYAVTLASVVVTSTLVPIIVKRLYDPSRKYAGYERRDIMHLKPNAELKILTCIHRSSNMPAVINLLDAACPSKENPINVCVLHLIELIGRTAPIFISHQVQGKTVSHVNTYSANVILYFNQFEKENRGAVNLSIFTAISPPNIMHEDICTLAMDKLTSLIILPFHRKWSIDGSSIESEDNTIRTLNFSVLERAPCSVGILVDRGHLGRSTSVVSTLSTFSVAVVFLGGKDDREALTFAKRMARDSTIRLTVIHLVAMGNEYAGGEWDKILDAEVLKEFKYNHVGEGLVIYLEEMVKDGPQTAFLLRSMVEEYDIIIVGRSHKLESPQTVGLSEWCEFPELGIIGDLLASPDVDCKASIVVMQQQELSRCK
ncbi:putative cation/H+ exchanger [Rosa chinensis]|uniref:Putative cation/H+ exchanger n=1 Tax=Rosa chinensis TaxID=74649 RepID=A0A2P6QKH9_ROSCH|nr:cation/H(+) antiporter 3 [Rosa chinensis]PRQ34681.1 putative cation/H+ exchanger [Rosa chinensis]